MKWRTRTRVRVKSYIITRRILFRRLNSACGSSGLAGGILVCGKEHFSIFGCGLIFGVRGQSHRKCNTVGIASLGRALCGKSDFSIVVPNGDSSGFLNSVDNYIQLYTNPNLKPNHFAGYAQSPLRGGDLGTDRIYKRGQRPRESYERQRAKNR